MELTFSQRMGFTPIREALQVDSMDLALRNALWNYCNKYIFHITYPYHEGYLRNDEYLQLVWTDFFKQIAVQKNYEFDQLLQRIQNHFVKAEWYKVYDLLEFLVKHRHKISRIGDMLYSQTRYIEDLNKILEKEMSGYRFIGTQITPITSEAEIESITAAQQNSKSSEHIKTAVNLLSNRESPDYRNSIKESISAVEAVCREITGKSTLGAALKAIEKNKSIEINSQFVSGLEKFYVYTNSEDTGIRHSLMDDTKEIKFEDAKFMLVICSAFINYITDKSK